MVDFAMLNKRFDYVFPSNINTFYWSNQFSVAGVSFKKLLWEKVSWNNLYQKWNQVSILQNWNSVSILQRVRLMPTMDNTYEHIYTFSFVLFSNFLIRRNMDPFY